MAGLELEAGLEVVAEVNHIQDPCLSTGCLVLVPLKPGLWPQWLTKGEPTGVGCKRWRFSFVLLLLLLAVGSFKS